MSKPVVIQHTSYKHEVEMEKKEVLTAGIACILTKLYGVENYDHEDGEVITLFHSGGHLNITISEYYYRLIQHSQCSAEAMLLGLHIVFKVVSSKLFRVYIATIHRLILTATLIAAKHTDDVYFNNRFYAKIGGIPTKELNGLEAELLWIVSWNLYVDNYQYLLADMRDDIYHPTLTLAAQVPAAKTQEIIIPLRRACTCQLHKFTMEYLFSMSHSDLDNKQNNFGLPS